MKEKNENNIANFLYKAGLFWLNVFIFLRLASLAANFARTYTTTFQPFVSHFLILLFAYGFFVVFRNLAQLAVSIEESDQKALLPLYKRIALQSVTLLLIILLTQILPEFLLSISVQLQ